MKFYLSDKNEMKEITVRSWDGSGYGPDCFDDLEICFKEDHQKVLDENGNEGEAFICESQEFEELLAWWEEEVQAMRDGTCAHDLDYAENVDKEIYLFTN